MTGLNVREQRAAPRFETDCVAEIALGAGVARALIVNMSVHGCGIEILDRDCDLPIAIDAVGLLNVELYKPRFTTMLPVRVCNAGSESERARYGLKFCGVSPREMNNILGLLDLIVLPSPEPKATR